MPGIEAFCARQALNSPFTTAMMTCLPRTFLAALLCAVAVPHVLLSQTESDSLTVVRIVNIHSKVAALQVASSYRNDTIVRTLGFPSVSQRLAYSGTLTDTLAFIATEPDRRLLARQALNIVPGRYYSVLVLPIGSQALIQPYYRDNRIDVPQENAYVQFLHGAADVPALDISLTDEKGKTTEFTIPGFGTLTAYDTTIAPGAFDITIKTLSDQRVIFEGKGLLKAGAFQTLVLSGLESADNIALGIFDQDDTAQQDPIRPVEKTSMSLASGDSMPDEDRGVTVSVSPNPARDGSRLLLSMKQSGTVSIGLYDLCGVEVKAMFRGLAPAGETTLGLHDLSGLTEGLYVLKVASAEGQTLAAEKVCIAGH